MGVIMFNGVTSSSLGIKVWAPPSYTFPEKEVETIHVPGRNGDLIIDKGSYKNITRTYNVSLYNPNYSYVDAARVITNWLHPYRSGYCDLYDTYDGFTFPATPAQNPETDYAEPSNYSYYRKAIFASSGEITNVHNKAGVFEISFTCKPQRFVVGGSWITSSTIVNNYGYAAKPIIKFTTTTQSTVLTINWSGSVISVITVTGASDVIYLDCETLDAYSINSVTGEKLNRSSRVTMQTGRPELNPGTTTLSVQHGSVEVLPRWWIL